MSALAKFLARLKSSEPEMKLLGQAAPKERIVGLSGLGKGVLGGAAALGAGGLLAHELGGDDDEEEMRHRRRMEEY